MRVRTWVNLIFLETIVPVEPYGDNVPPKQVFWLSFSQYGGFCGKNLKAIFDTPFPTENVIFVFVVRQPIYWKMVVSHKNYFSQLFWKILFFFLKKLLNEQYSNPCFSQKVPIDFCLQTSPSPQTSHILPQMVFHNFSNTNWRTSVKFSCSKVHSCEIKFNEE